MTPLERLTIEQKIEIALQLKDTASFFRKYFELLPKFKTQKECFEYLNDIHLIVFETEKYSHYDSFRQCMHRDGQKYLKSKS